MSRRDYLKKAIAFLLTVLVLCSTSLDSHLRISIAMDVCADPLSPENAITFAAGISIVNGVFLIDNEHYIIGKDSSGSNCGIYKLDIGARALTRVCNVSGYIPGASEFVGYAKVGTNHRFMFSTITGVTGDKYEKISVISSPDMQSFTLAKLNAISIWNAYGCSTYFCESDGYYYISGSKTLARESDDGYWEKEYLLYKSTDCVNWSLQSSGISASEKDSVIIHNSQAVGASNQQLVLTKVYKYESDTDSGYRDYFWEYNLYAISGSQYSNIDSAVTAKWRDSTGDDYIMQSDDEEIKMVSYGRFAFVFHNELYMVSRSTGSISTDSEEITLYYGTNEYNCGGSQRLSNSSTLTYYDNGIYNERIGTHKNYLYYKYTPSTALPAGTYKINVITGGTSMSDTNILSMTDYLSSDRFITPAAIYLKVTHTNGGITYHRLQNGAAATITEAQYISAKAALPLEPPISEYTSLGYGLKYADSVKAIFFNDTDRAFKIIYPNTVPSVTTISPSDGKIYGTKDTAVIPQIMVSDPDNNALTCKYYIDGVVRETRTIASNTSIPQTVSFTAVNMGSMAEKIYVMKVEVSDGMLTAQATVNFRVDKTPPVISKLEATTTENSITITAAASDETAYLDTYPYNYTVTDGTNTYQSGWKARTTHTQGLLLPNKNYTVKLEAKDGVGNIGTKSITVYTKALKPVITASNITTTAMDIIEGEKNPSNTKYLIVVGTKYVSSNGVLADTQQWIILTNKKIRVTGLTPNTNYSITAKAMNGANEVTLTSTPVTKTTLPSAPESLTASPDKKFITLTWSAMPNIIRYELWADGAIKDAGNKNSYIHEGLEPNTQHRYKVRAVNAGGTGEWSNEITKATLPDPPGTPINLWAKAEQGSIIFGWDQVEGATSYDVKADGDMKADITATTYTHTDLEPNTPHEYIVRAKSKGGEGNWSDILKAETLPEPPGIPEGLQIPENGITKETITLIWNSTERAEVYDICEGEGNIFSTEENTYTYTGLKTDTEYTFKIRARNRNPIPSDWSVSVIGRTLPEKPGIPRNLTATSGTNEITLTWDNTDRAVDYVVEDEGKILATITGTSYVHEGLDPDSKHTYRVKARNTGGDSDYSAILTAYTLSETAGMALTNVAAVVTNTSITLMWDAVAADIGYDVEVDGEIKDNEKNTMYIHSGLQSVTSHTYKIRPKRGEENGPWCAVLAISTLPDPPDALKNIRVEVTNTTIKLTWDPEDRATGYDIEIDGSSTLVNTKETTYIHEGLEPGTEHSYRIRARNITGATPWSEAIVKSTIKPTYVIEAEAGEEYHIALTAKGMQEFKGKKLVLSYNPEEAELVDLCEETRELELESGKIPGTNIQINHVSGRIEIEFDKMIDPGKTWTGVVDTILIRAKVTGQISLDYVVE